ncbi:Seven TM Receptor [Caenorhabditis elegans]|uniref:Seven TM Receptor n=1 Tax=Caenorhabditis elegans TaxID=6239 RepID=A0A131MBA3_CAEEL|nr:Seven TM Receptor [Caenorhabditis elegans]CZR14599.1 Seven TM Receptor [Caenorhabditis elegans]|eukprot:NP_001309673.1 Seven TM Receptor [Caenorhabditis elegans]
MSTDYLEWISISYIIVLVGFAATLIFGLLLIILNIFCVRGVFITYRILMITFTCSGILFSTFEVVFNPNMFSYNSGTIYFTLSKPFGFGKDVLTVSLVVYTGLYSATTCLIAIQFIYRYWAVFDETKLRLFHGWHISIWIIYVLYFGMQWAIGAYNFVKTDQVAKDFFREEIMLRFNASIDDLPALSLVAFDPSNGSIRWWNVMTIVNMSFIMSIQYGIIIYCGWSMYSKMEEKIKNYSIVLQKHHNQLFKTLVLQIIAPTVFLLTPLSFIIYLPFFNIKCSLPTGVLLSLFTLYPTADSVVVIYVVTEYRQKLKHCFITTLKNIRCWKNNQINVQGTTQTRTM